MSRVQLLEKDAASKEQRQDPVTIGEVLETVAVAVGDKTLDDGDVRAIESAESRVTGGPPVRDGIASTARLVVDLRASYGSAATQLPGLNELGNTTLADVLADATEDLPADKTVTHEDAMKVVRAELRGRKAGNGEKVLQPGGVAATMVAAADLNDQSGDFPPQESVAS